MYLLFRNRELVGEYPRRPVFMQEGDILFNGHWWSYILRFDQGKRVDISDIPKELRVMALLLK